MKNAFGKNLRHQREKLGLTQGELAKRLFVSFQAVSAWERGSSIPDLENAVRLSKVLGIGLDSLLRDREETLYVGIDGGGTKTEFCAFLPDGTVTKRIVMGTTNPNDIGEEKSFEVLYKGLDQLLDGATPRGIFAGIAGLSVGQWRTIFKDRLKKSYNCEIWTDTDAANVLSMGADPENSAMVICGTGSCVFVRRNEKAYRLGGWGQLFDESGSAYDVGKDAIRYTLAVRDGLAEPSALSEGVEKMLGCSIFDGLRMLYEKGRPYIASFARLVVDMEAKGDTVSHQIMQKNANRLGMLMRTAKERYGTDGVFVASGGFFSSEVFCQMVQEASGCKLYLPELPPIYGACVEAMRQSNIAVNEEFKKNFTESYRRQIC